MRVRVLASDYDDTLAREGVVQAETITRLVAARRAGIKLVLITGRRIPELVEVFTKLSLVDLVVAENGGYLFAPASAVGWRVAPGADVRLVADLERRGVEPLAVGETIIATDVACSDAVESALAAHHGPYRYEAIRNRHSLMLLPHGTDKGSGLREALRFLRVPASACLAVGDAENDVAMMRVAGRGAAVGDAVQQLKDAADQVLSRPGPSGVVELVDELMDGHWELHERTARAG